MRAIGPRSTAQHALGCTTTEAVVPSASVAP